MAKYLPIAQIILAIILITSILLQQQGTGLGGAFGAESNVYRSKRGIEKFLFYFTIVIACLFVIIAVIDIIANQ